jgi:hypothetical protein
MLLSGQYSQRNGIFCLLFVSADCLNALYELQTGEATMDELHVRLDWLCDPRKPVTLERLPEFFQKRKDNGLSYGDKVGIYFWIYKNQSNGRERIAAVGETKNFRKRFADHLKAVLHGQYTAVDCPPDKDLTDYYKRIDKNNPYYSRLSAGDRVEYYDPLLDWGNFDTIVQNYRKIAAGIKKGIDIGMAYFENMRFAFAAMEPEAADAKVRKEIEALFILRLRGAILNEKKDLKAGDLLRNGYFWGPVSCNLGTLAEKTYAVSSVEGSCAVDAAVRTELDLSEPDAKNPWKFRFDDTGGKRSVYVNGRLPRQDYC